MGTKLKQNEFKQKSSTITNGFYYDIQKSNPLLSITLHRNSELDDKGEWVKYKGETVSGYSKDAICTALLDEDFTVDVSNDWSNFDGGDFIGGFWNTIKPSAAISKEISKSLRSMKISGDKAVEDNNYDSWFINKLQGFVGKAANIAEGATEYLNRHLITEGTRFSYYSGTDTTFSNLNMKFIVFADWKIDENGACAFTTIENQLKDLYPYVMGQYVPVTNNDISKITDSNIQQENTGEEEAKTLGSFFGWQKPPGGFRADMFNVDTIQEGTLLLRFGSFYCLENLVVKDAKFTYSKQMVKDPTTGNFSPLYCEVSLMFQPATKYTNKKMEKFINGSSMEGLLNENRKYVSDSLSAEKEEINKLIEDYEAREQEKGRRHSL